MSQVSIYHNPRCSKSRQTLQLIREAGVEPEIIEYLKNPPTVHELRKILDKLGLPVKSIIRKGEDIYKNHFKDKDFTQEEWLAKLVEYPKLLERPIVIKEDKAVLGRPPENVISLL